MGFDDDTRNRLSRVPVPRNATEVGDWQYLSSRKDHVRRFTVKRWTRAAVVVEVGGTQDSHERVRVRIHLAGVATLTAPEAIWLESILREANLVIAGIDGAS